MQIIAKDTTWAAGQVINLTEDVQVAPGVTLTIAPGAQITGGYWTIPDVFTVPSYHSIQVYGTLKAQGSVGSEIFFSRVLMGFGDDYNNYGNIILDYTQIDGAAISHPTGIRAYGKLTLTNSIVSNAADNVGSNYTSFSAETLNSIISGNIFEATQRFELSGAATLTITNNIFDQYKLGAIWAGGELNISNNAFLFLAQPTLYLQYDSKLTSTGDYFGGATQDQLNTMIYDRNDTLSIKNYVNLQNVRSTPSSSLPTDMFTFTSIDMPSDIVKTARIVGGADVKLKGNKLDNIITVNSGNNTIDGGSGVDTVVVHGSSAQYQFSVQNGSAVIKDTIFSRDGTNTLTNIEHIQFTDGTIAADLAVTPDNALIYRLYQAAFARMPDEGGLRYWVGQHGKGLSVNDMAPLFRGSQEFTQKYGSNLTNAQYVDQLYLNVLGRKGETGGVTYWNDVLDSGKATKDTVLIGFAGSPENVSGTAAHIDHGFFIG